MGGRTALHAGTALAAPADERHTMQKIEEIKRHKNKPEQRFLCDLALREPGHIVLVYHASTAGRIADIDIAPGSTTIAHYWQAWRLCSVAHVCRRPHPYRNALSYLRQY